MERISFESVLPQVFTHHKDFKSEIWNSKVTFEKGYLYLVEAESGKGKSTFCSYISGYRHDYTGHILFDETDISTYKMCDWVNFRRRHISHLFQELRLFRELTAFENVEIKNQLTRWKSSTQIKEWFEQLDIADKLGVEVGKMSYGQQQRVAMMRALVQPFDFLLLDEPMSHLDDNNAQTMAEIMLAEAREQEAAVIVTSIGKHTELPYERILRL
ncbi:ABC transporter, ATP-binding protein [Hoylesella saccharolytica F0055]|uniref:ABC transporter, ATP-binding protein n=1 Tax=Hoylesella saccharolytica F0055 TaxID=1127699 RepID=L1N9K7_9BACT|nr:ATP-binding cassette domain-containing protein [Hoylesella saccharolytica]EKX99861.1 ABC transporter, ATP-binding protein [Hoylesella saccharolytica F0055]